MQLMRFNLTTTAAATIATEGGPNMTPKLKPKQVAPLFGLTALAHALALTSRYAEIYAVIPAVVHTAILMAHGPLLLIEGYFEGRLDYGKNAVSLPLWMRIKSRPVKVAFALALAYLGIVVLQTWDFSFLPVDPNPPESWPLSQKRFWFVVMTASVLFPSYLLSATAVIPLLRFATRPLRWLGRVGGPIGATVIGLGLGWGAVLLVSSGTVSSQVAAFQKIAEQPLHAFAIAMLTAWIPILFGLLPLRKKR